MRASELGQTHAQREHWREEYAHITDEEVARLFQETMPEIAEEKAYRALAYMVPATITTEIRGVHGKDIYGDLLAEGDKALILAIRAWEPGQGSTLKTYAYTYIKRYTVKAYEEYHERQQTEISVDVAEAENRGGDHWVRNGYDPITSDHGSAERNAVRAMQLRDYLRTLPADWRKPAILMAEGNSVREIARITGRSRSDIGRIRKSILDNLGTN